MSSVNRPQVRCELHHATLSVGDVRASAEFYATKLGFVVAFTEGDPPTFAGVATLTACRFSWRKVNRRPWPARSISSSTMPMSCARGIDRTESRLSSRCAISRTGCANMPSVTWTATICILATDSPRHMSADGSSREIGEREYDGPTSIAGNHKMSHGGTRSSRLCASS